MKNRLAELVEMGSPYSVMGEIIDIVRQTSPSFDFKKTREAFYDVEALFAGRYEGYQKCNTDYHDINHTMDVTLAAVRTLHGAKQSGLPVNDRMIEATILGSLLHDTGYIQREGDVEGTGAKYTLDHVERSVEFAHKYMSERQAEDRDPRYTSDDFTDIAMAIEGTSLGVKASSLNYPSQDMEFVGKIVASADLMGQMADEKYLAKLTFLSREFIEGHVPGFEDQMALLSKTAGFYGIAKNRLDTELGGVRKLVTAHFKSRGIDADLYAEAMDGNMNELNRIMRELPNEADKYIAKMTETIVIVNKPGQLQADPFAKVTGQINAIVNTHETDAPSPWDGRNNR